jgi:hypothetical protein
VDNELGWSRSRFLVTGAVLSQGVGFQLSRCIGGMDGPSIDRGEKKCGRSMDDGMDASVKDGVTDRHTARALRTRIEGRGRGGGEGKCMEAQVSGRDLLEGLQIISKDERAENRTWNERRGGLVMLYSCQTRGGDDWQ